MPLTIRDDASMASYVLQNSVTTWQAYNLWGDYSLYYGPDRIGRAELRQPGPRRLLRPPLSADVGLGRGRLRRQRAAAALPPREPRARPDLLDRRRPARQAPAARQPPLPLQPGPRRVLVARRCARPPRRPVANGVNLAFLGANAVLPPDPPGAELGRAQPPRGLLQGRGRGPAGDAAARRSPRSTGTRRRSTSPSRPSSAPCTSRWAPRPTWWSPTRRRGSTTAAT